MPIVAPGSDWDTHKCITSAGYSFCEVLGRCIRLWEEACSIPNNCLTWNDGCNVCNVLDGNLELCTEMYCITHKTPYCMVYQPDAVINPFLDGH